MAAIYDSPRGEAYEWLIDYAVERSDMFMVARRGYLQCIDGEDRFMLAGEGNPEWMEGAGRIFALLEPYLVEEYTITSEEHELRFERDITPGRGIEYSPGSFYMYRCCKESAAVLKEAATALYDWQHPRLPEDLTFVDHEGRELLYQVAHERMGGLQVEEDEARRLAQEVPGLFLCLPEHREFEAFWEAVLFHQPRRLEIFGFGITEIPGSIRQLTDLRELMVHESYVTRLPEGMFELRSLESLTVYTANLLEIPAGIGKLSSLRHLTIACGSYHDSVDVILPRQDVSLNRIPPEIGQLSRLENLCINYTAITDVPVELRELKKLRWLSLGRNRLASAPAVIGELPQLEYVDLDDNLYNPRSMDWNSSL